MMQGRFIDRVELFNRLATLNTEDIEYKTAVFQLVNDAEGISMLCCCDKFSECPKGTHFGKD